MNLVKEIVNTLVPPHHCRIRNCNHHGCGHRPPPPPPMHHPHHNCKPGRPPHNKPHSRPPCVIKPPCSKPPQHPHHPPGWIHHPSNPPTGNCDCQNCLGPEHDHPNSGACGCESSTLAHVIGSGPSAPPPC